MPFVLIVLGLAKMANLKAKTPSSKCAMSQAIKTHNHHFLNKIADAIFCHFPGSKGQTFPGQACALQPFKGHPQGSLHGISQPSCDYD